ncbi:hypothetical protein PCC6912_65900 [Chlorogloeopsis fritschii PCC 6912]|uniref:Transposase n=1 Tax=Chlorogloeopsis fritschii PCC 6912 TaxID=211165 RepID=A0A433MVP4_CHLFR|nr:hypothetical protein PCC6912_65900 [Chlorogloeopsis fritschii PCC 6912]
MGRGRRDKIRLSAEQRQNLEMISRNGHAAAKKILHARVLLMSDEGEYGKQRWNDQQIEAALGLHRNSVARIRSSFLKQGEQAALNRKPRQTSPVSRKLDGEKEAYLIAICCSPPPDGRTRWTLKLLVTNSKRVVLSRKLVVRLCDVRSKKRIASVEKAALLYSRTRYSTLCSPDGRSLRPVY